jgi:ribonuclease HI
VRLGVETHCDHLRKYKDLRTDYPQLTAAEYETIAGEICFRGRIIHADIATEAGLKLEHNSPLHDDRRRAQCSRNDALTLEAWTDGSADAQAQNVGYAVYWGENHLLNYSRRMPHEENTNNTAELSAVLHVLSVIARDENIIIYTDSQVTMRVVAALQKNLDAPHALHSLTKKDNVTTARAKRAIFAILQERRNHNATTELSHVYSHLLDSPSSMEPKSTRVS